MESNAIISAPKLANLSTSLSKGVIMMGYFSEILFANFADEVVFPDPCNPAIRIITGGLDFKFISGKIDSGVFIRGNQSETNPQIQIGESGSLKRDMTGSPRKNKKGYPIEANEVSKNLKFDGWNKMGIKVVDNNYIIKLNGVQILDYNLEYSNLPGPIGLQIHKSRDMEIWFKDINITEI